MKLEAGKYYRRRDGVVVGPAQKLPYEGLNFPYTLGEAVYTNEGCYYSTGVESRIDLVAEVSMLTTTDQRSLRDEFAMAALTGLLALEAGPKFKTSQEYFNHYAKFSYAYADAMMKEREK